MAIKAILFDKDGTLIDFNATWGRATHDVFLTIANGDLAIVEKLSEVSDYDLEKKRIRMRSPIVSDSPVELAILWADLVGKTPGPDFEKELDEMFTAASLENLVPLKDTGQALSELQEKGYQLGVATNDSAATAKLHMQALDWEEHFTTILGYDSGHGSKPGPGMVNAFLDHTGCSANECVMVGDSRHDLDAGKAATVFSVGVRTGPMGGRGLDEHADAVIDTLADLPGLLQQAPFNSIPTGSTD